MDLGAHLSAQLELRERELVSLVGGGGKTTLMRALAMHGTQSGRSVVAGTTTKVYASQAADLPNFLHRATEGDKLIGVEPNEVNKLFEATTHHLVVIEADGSRGRVVKAPAPHEPPIPTLTTHVLVVIGADGLDRVIEDVAHRPMRVAAVCGCGPYERLTVERATRLITSERGMRKHVPDSARFTVAITRVGERQKALAGALADSLLLQGVTSVVLPLCTPDPHPMRPDR